MAIYEYYCPKCEKQTEVITRIGDFVAPQCCGESMVKLMSLPQPAIFPVSGRNQVVNTLNDDEKGLSLPDKSGKHTARYKEVLKKSLSREKEVVGKGF